MIGLDVNFAPQGLRKTMNAAYRAHEKSIVTTLLEHASLTSEEYKSIKNIAIKLVQKVRENKNKGFGIDSFLSEYSLSTEEGIALMCLAEAFLRVPDNTTVDNLIKDKLMGVDWSAHKGASPNLFVNAATWALMLSGKILTTNKSEYKLAQAIKGAVNRIGENVVRAGIERAMHIMSKQFVMGRTIEQALSRGKKKESQGYRYSFDMLGEAALTEKDADRYFQAYKKAIEKIGESAKDKSNVYERNGISIKLSALHPRYQESHRERVLNELSKKLLLLAQSAKAYDIGLTIDAEESERLDLSLDVIEVVFNNPSLRGWNGFGLAVQSYQKRAFYLLDWIAELARKNQSKMIVRLIKGAYWDSEIKKTQMQGFKDYPVFTRKVYTDISFQACAKKLLTMTDAIYPQFATHNAYTVAMILEITAREKCDFEFQCLHGMGTSLYEQIVAQGIPCRIYAPVGSHEDLLPYLVRRLLENGANSSFVNRIADEALPIENLVENPIEVAKLFLNKLNRIPLPENIMPDRKNSKGLDLSDREVKMHEVEKFIIPDREDWQGYPIIANQKIHPPTIPVQSPQNLSKTIGIIQNANSNDIENALKASTKTFRTWSKTSVEERANYLEKFAQNLEQNRSQLLSMLCFEAGKTWNDSISEIREAIDFCYYYAMMAKKLMSTPIGLEGYTGETNELSLHPRGTVLCISPWNFPLAIFVGQMVAAIATGNCVIAKPAEQTSLIATFATNLLLKTGLPSGVVQLLPGTGEEVGATLVSDPRIKAVIFTGSTETARKINQDLAMRPGEIIPFIAETGGQNAMIVDSSALLEQVVIDVINSSFGSAGQRCSALRVLYIQEEVFDRAITLLKGAMEELEVGDPMQFNTDIGPVIDKEALSVLKKHCEEMAKFAEIIYEGELHEELNGYFMRPTVIKIADISVLKKEVFGPILHVISFKSSELDQVINQINSTNFGLTLGIHSRIDETIAYIQENVHVGNCYVNRNMIGAVVGLQPFGGEGLSGTGFKAGGPHYLLRLCTERTLTRDTTAAGGNASLMALPEY